MPTVALQAHYDGEHIILDEPYDLPANASLMVTLLPSPPDADSEAAWLRAAAATPTVAHPLCALTVIRATPPASAHV